MLLNITKWIFKNLLQKCLYVGTILTIHLTFMHGTFISKNNDLAYHPLSFKPYNVTGIQKNNLPLNAYTYVQFNNSPFFIHTCISMI